SREPMSRPSSRRDRLFLPLGPLLGGATLVGRLLCGAMFVGPLLLGALTALGCASEAPARFATASTLPGGERRPDGVAVDRVSEPPAFRDEAASDDGIVTLRAPLGLDVAQAA